MAKTYIFKVLFNPCRRIKGDGYIVNEVKIDFGNQFGGWHVFESTVKDVPNMVERIANDVRNGEGVAASVSLYDRNARKPAGFDLASRGLQFGVRLFDNDGNEITTAV